MKNVFIQAMNESFDLSAMLARIDYHHIREHLTDAEREELIALARSKATPFGSVDVMMKLGELETRIRALEENKADPGAEEFPAYIPGKWYYRGDKVTFSSEHFLCIAPEGTVCTWSPAEYPAYWEQAE